MSLDLAMLKIALDEDMVTEGVSELEALVDEGPAILDRTLRGHRLPNSRGGMGMRLRRRVQRRLRRPPGPGTVVVIEDTRFTVNERPRLWVTVEVCPADGAPFTLRKKFTVSRGALSRVGDPVEVAYDPADPNDFAYRRAPRVEAAEVAPPDSSDRIAQLKDLAELREADVLTEAEFEAEKRRVLDS